MSHGDRSSKQEDRDTERQEVTALEDIAEHLDIDQSKFRAMINKSLPVQFHEDQSPEAVLGITSDMTPEQINTRLKEEFRKWNARTSNSDPAIRKQAQDMLDLIGELRAKI